MEKYSDTFLVGNLPAVKYKNKVIIYDYFNSKIAEISEKDFLNNKLPALSYNGIPCNKKCNPKKSTLTLILNRDCNMHCIYCFAHGGEKKDIISNDCIKEAIKKAIKPETKEILLSFFGGEPTLCYNKIVFALNEINKYKNIQKKFAISTNGIMNLKVLNFIIKNRFTINLSMDGIPEIQNSQRPLASGLPSSKIVEDVIRKLSENNISFKVRITVTEKSVNRMEETVKYLADLRVKYIHFEVVNLSGRARDLNVKRPNINDFIKNYKNCLKIAKKLGVTLVNGVYINLVNPSCHSCSAVTGGKLIITPEGNITRCYEVQDKSHPYADKFLVGEYDKNKNNFKLELSKVNKLIDRTSDSNLMCKDCFAKYICSGGCVIRNLHGLNCNNIKLIDPYQCKLMKSLIKDAIIKIYKESKK